MKTNDKIIIKGVIVSIIIFVIGYGVLSIMYFCWKHSSNNILLKGLYDYKASAIGDSICLPILIGSLVVFKDYFKYDIKKKFYAIFPIIVAFVFLLIGVIVQISWIVSDECNPNWSIPEVHHFNYAGWYHAVFFVLIFYLLGLLITKMFVSEVHISNLLRKNDINTNKERLYIICQFLIWFSGMFFLQLHFIDDYAKKVNINFIIVFTAVFVGIVAFISKKIIFRRIKNIKIYLPIILAMIVSTILSFVSVQGDVTNSRYFFVSMLLIIIYVSNSDNVFKMFIVYIICAGINYILQVMLYNAFYYDDSIKILVLLAINIIIPCLISLTDYGLIEKNIKMGLKISFIGIIAQSIIIFYINYNSIIRLIPSLEKSSAFLSLLFPFFLSVLIPAFVRVTFDFIILKEDDETIKVKDVEFFKLKQYIMYVIIYLAALIILIGYFDFNLNYVYNSLIKYLIIAFSLLVSMFSVFMHITKNIGKSFVLLIINYFIIFLYSVISNIIHIQENNVGLSNIEAILVFSLLMSCSVSLCLSFGFINNVALIRQKDAEKITTISCVLIGVFCGIIYGLNLIEVMLTQSVFSIIQLVIVLLVSFALIPFLQAKNINKDGNIGIIHGYTWAGVIQDGVLYSILATINPIVSVQIINYISNKENLLNGLTILINYSTMLLPIVNYCIKNNVELCKRMYDLLHIKKTDNSNNNRLEKIQYKNLKSFLTIQNTVTLIMTFPYSVFYLIKKGFDKIYKVNDFKSIFPDD